MRASSPSIVAVTAIIAPDFLEVLEENFEVEHQRQVSLFFYLFINSILNNTVYMENKFIPCNLVIKVNHRCQPSYCKLSAALSRANQLL